MKNYCLSVLLLLFVASLQAQTVLQGIEISQTEGCKPLSVDFAYTSSATEYQWDFGNGQSSTTDQPSIIYNQAGEYSVKLIVKIASSKYDTIYLQDIIRVFDQPESKPVAKTYFICTQESIQFDNQSINASSYQWNFGDGTTSKEENPVHEYENSGLYTVTLLAASDGGCEHRSELPKQIQVYDSDDFSINTTGNTLCSLEDVLQAEIEAPVDIDDVVWYMGNGDSLNHKNLDYSYLSSGTYSLSAKVVDVHGCIKNIFLDDSIQVFNDPRPELILKDSIICEGDYATIEIKDKLEGKFLWTVNGEESRSSSVSFIPTKSKPYSVRLEYTNQNGCTSILTESFFIEVQEVPDANFGSLSQQSCQGSEIQLVNLMPEVKSTEWEINDSIVNGNDINFLFEESGYFSIRAKVYFENGCSQWYTLAKDYDVKPAFTDADISTFGACAPTTVDFTLNNDGAKDVKWYLNDNLVANTSQHQYSFNETGSYLVRVEYLNQYGCEISYTFDQNIFIYGNEVFLEEPDTVYSCTFTEVYFTGDIGQDFWQWDFGDGNTSSEKNPTHAYETSGVYTVSLTTNNRYGCRTTIENYNIIELAKIEPEFTYSTSKGGNCGEFVANFETSFEEGYKAYWYFQDALIGTGERVSASFFSATDVNLSLRLQHEGSNCSKYISKVVKNPWGQCEIEIPDAADMEMPTAPFGRHEFNSCTKPYTLSLENPIDSATYFEWRFQDGSSSTQDLEKVFTEFGLYSIDYYVEFNQDSSLLVEDYIKVSVVNAVVDFEVDVQYSCDMFELFVEPNESDFDIYRWELNGKAMNPSSEGSFMVNKAGLYQISLQADNQMLCEATKIKNVVVGNLEKEFNYANKLCNDEALQIENNLIGFNSFKWELGNGDTFNGTNLNYTYPSAGIFTVTLIGIDKEGCEHEIKMPRSVMVSKPVARFEPSVTQGCGSLEVSFNNLSQDADSYLWDFGNGTTSTLKNPSINYSAGSYKVSLTVKKGSCESVYYYPEFIVVDSLSSEFEFTQATDCLPVEVRFTNLSSNASSFLWDFGDGTTSSEENPVHVYNSIPKRKVKLTAFTDEGCGVSSSKQINPIFDASFSVNKQKVCDSEEVEFTAKSSLIKTYFWDFGDGNTSNEPKPKHLYAEEGLYTVKLIGQSESGCVDTVTYANYIEVKELSASFTLEYDEGNKCVPLAVQFTNESEGASSYLWDFGDGSSSTVRNPQHVYTSAGDFEVSLTVFNELGCEETFRISEGVKASGPETSFSVSESIICLPQPVQFIDESLEAVSWKWFFGDGSTSTEQNPEHIYTKPGYYSVTLLATNADGCSQSFEMDSIRAIKSPYAQFEMEISGDCSPVEITLKNNSRNLSNAKFLWDFGDGNTSSEAEPRYTYTTPGSFNVTLSVINDGYCQSDFVSMKEVLVRDTITIKEAEVSKLMIDEHVMLSIKNPGLTSLSHYEVYKGVGDSLSFYQNLPADATSFMDLECNPSEYPHLYAFKAVNFCEDTISSDQLTTYSSIHLQKKSALAKGTVSYFNELRWTKSRGFSFDHYKVLRKQENQEQWYEIAQLSPEFLSFNDSEELCPGTYLYKIVAIEEGEAVNTSNTISQEFSGDWVEEQVATSVTSTVIEEGEAAIFTEWKVPEKGKSLIAYYEILRSVDEGEFELYDQISEPYYLDKAVDVNKSIYRYKIRIINNCELASQYSKEAASLRVEKETKFERHELSWEPYQGWGGNVSGYLIQRKNEDGEWETIKVVPPNQNKVIIKDTKNTPD